MTFINKNKVTMAHIIEPYEQKNPLFGSIPSHGWQVVLFFGHTSDGDYVKEHIDCKSEDDCKKIIEKLNLIEI